MFYHDLTKDMKQCDSWLLLFFFYSVSDFSTLWTLEFSRYQRKWGHLGLPIILFGHHKATKEIKIKWVNLKKKKRKKILVSCKIKMTRFLCEYMGSFTFPYQTLTLVSGISTHLRPVFTI